MQKDPSNGIVKSLGRLPRRLRQLHLKAALRLRPAYQPVLYRGMYIGAAHRNCFDRWELIRTELVRHAARTVLDIGCAEGFYVLRAAKEFGCFALGVEADRRRLSVADDQLILEHISNAGFILGVVKDDLLSKLPKSDLVLFLSIMHHMMYSAGVEYCREYLFKLRSIVGSALIFEMGQSNETKNEWAGKLPDMGENPHVWIREFLLSAGFSRVEKIGETDSYKKDQRRAVFSALPE